MAYEELREYTVDEVKQAFQRRDIPKIGVSIISLPLYAADLVSALGFIKKCAAQGVTKSRDNSPMSLYSCF